MSSSFMPDSPATVAAGRDLDDEPRNDLKGMGGRNEAGYVFSLQYRTYA